MSTAVEGGYGAFLALVREGRERGLGLDHVNRLGTSATGKESDFEVSLDGMRR